MAIYDISVPIHPGMVIYRGNPGFDIGLASAIADGSGANISSITMGAHTGTHIDGPSHFLDGAPGTEALDLAAMIGPAVVIDLPSQSGPIDRASLEAAAIPEGTKRMILKTPNSLLWEREEFTHDFVRLDGSGAEFVLERGIRLIGIDYLSIGDGHAHRALLGAGVVALEGLDLRGITPGAYQMTCLPLRLVGSDGAPARVILSDLEESGR